MIRSAHRSRFRITVAATAALLTACTTAPDSPAHDPASSSVARARLSRDLPTDPVRMVLPATGAESRWTQGLDVFVQQVARVATDSCARRRGTGLPEEAPVAFIRYFELPDLDFIARHGTSESAAVPATPGSPVPTAPSSAAAVRACRTEGRAAASALRDSYAALQGRWFTELTSLRGDPRTVRALRTLSGCLAGRGIRVRDENAFFALSDARMQTVAQAELPRTERQLGSAYAACMRPVEAVREPARLRLRARFLSVNAAEIRTLRTTLVPALRRAEKRYGVQLAFPEP